MLEDFPVGRRLAFDPAKGRLWVVCRGCERWNLTPLEERWEAIEQAERLYRESRLRAATDQIGLARLRDGTELVRIGEPMRPEFAAWRYGDQFGRRRNRRILVAGVGVAAVGALVVGGAVAGVSVFSFGGLFQSLGNLMVHGNPRSVVAQFSTPDGDWIKVRRRHLAESSFGPTTEGGLSLDLKHERGRTHFDGREAARISGLLIPQVNRFGGSKKVVADAVMEIEYGGGPEGFIENVGLTGHVLTRVPEKRPGWRWKTPANKYSTGLFGLPAPRRLALEMALHEEAERRAMMGELTELEAAWRQADEIAGIADNLLLPESVAEHLREMKEHDHDEGAPRRLDPDR